MGPTLFIYLAYGAVAIGLTVWLARTLHNNGTAFLADIFSDRPELATAINRLLVVGFYMLNLGYSFLLLREPVVSSAEQAGRLLINRLGVLLVTLGLIHFVNMLVFWKIRRRTLLDMAPPPVTPQVMISKPDSEPFPA